MNQPLRIVLFLGVAALGAALPALADELCATSPLDTPPAGGGVVNSYYPGVPGQLAPGTTGIPVGAVDTTGGGSATEVAAGDLLLIIQMQDATINFMNDDRYGDNTQGDGLGQGMVDPRNVGRFEYLVATGAVGSVNPGEVPVQGTGPGSGTNFTYTNADATATEGQRRYQVIRVPRYGSLDMTSLTGSITAGYWNGNTGGVLAIEVVGALTLSPTNRLVGTGRGFRGGMGQRLTGIAGASAADYRYPSLAGWNNPSNLVGAHGNKGEGIAGTPRYVRDSAAGTSVENGAEGYPDGSRARGAPGNAGGGGTDSNPGVGGNNQSAGGGGGGNGGPGGKGGDTSDDQPLGGNGGPAFLDPAGGTPLWGPGRLVMGGGGGSGSKNDNNPDQSSAGAGGAILLIRVGSLSGTGAIESNGREAVNTGNDGAGGGGAGGSVLLVVKNSDLTGVTLTVNADGGDGANAGTGNSIRGPGAGGGGGVILMNAVTGGSVTATTTPGANGLTESETNPHGSTSGTVGTPPPGDPSNPYIDPSDVPGAGSGADCNLNDPPVAVDDAYNTPLDTPLTVPAPGVLGNDTDPEGDALTAVKVSDPASGALTFNADGSFDFTPAMGFIGTVTFTYKANDGNLDSNVATVTITVGEANDPPAVAAPADQVIDEDTVLTFAGGTLITVSDPDAGANDIQVTLTATNGTLTLAVAAGLSFSAGDGTADALMTFQGTLAEINAALDGMAFTPTANFSGAAGVQVDVDDLGWSGPGATQVLPGLTATDTVGITVNPINDAPVAAPDAYTVSWRGTLAPGGSGVLGNDSDVDSVMTAVLDAPPSSGTLVLNSDGSFTYTPVKDKKGGVVTFSYHATDGTLDSAVTLVTITILPGLTGDGLGAGYCGLTGLEGFAVLALLALVRRRRR